MQVNDRPKPYQVPPRYVADNTITAFKDELEWLQKQHIILPLGAQGLTTNNIFPNLTDMNYPTLIDASLGYPNLKLDEIIIPYIVCMPLWEVQICETTIQSCFSVIHVLEKAR